MDGLESRNSPGRLFSTLHSATSRLYSRESSQAEIGGEKGISKRLTFREESTKDKFRLSTIRAWH